MLNSIRDCFVTGKWEDGQDAATLLKEDGKRARKTGLGQHWRKVQTSLSVMYQLRRAKNTDAAGFPRSFLKTQSSVSYMKKSGEKERFFLREKLDVELSGMMYRKTVKKPTHCSCRTITKALAHVCCECVCFTVCSAFAVLTNPFKFFWECHCVHIFVFFVFFFTV